MVENNKTQFFINFQRFLYILLLIIILLIIFNYLEYRPPVSNIFFMMKFYENE